MSSADPKQTPRKQKQKESRSKQPPNGAERLKTVVRRLPPNLPEEIFWQSVQAWVSDETVTWRAFYPGKTRKRVNKESLPSRAYIAFKNEEQVATFSREYDGHLFRDKAGKESHAVVEFSPFQKIPTEKKKIDARNNTIDKDEDYISFIESLKSAEKNEPLPLEALIAASQPPPPPTTTPLLEALKAEKSAQKDKEAILRNHAHYKDPVASGLTSKKEEAKKKAAAATAAQVAKQPEPPAPPASKKGKKAAAAAAAAAAQKAPLPNAQHGQTAPPKGQHVSAGGPSTTKPSAPAPPTAPRVRPPREPHGRQPSAKGTIVAPAPAPAPPTSTEGVAVALPPAQAQGQLRRGRPVIGLGRQFEAALSGAGVAVGQGGDRKKRDKGGEPGSGTAEGSVGSGNKGKESRGKQREEKSRQTPVVPSILQRPESAAGLPDVVIMQRPLSPPGVEGTGGNVDASAGRGGARRGRGRGRGGNRGG
ncbi:hypothetical protein PAXRUDRAFT_153590 [Paxillus rubicundulus Ve08.2h10]|uniref:UPF3 domain-containing protein n=1 Tax=Paxillus rubicundulus Ve08.2h10 TaxID=930991 RepID=A0A0D0DRX4_9AGAM|nr:hypothetical protein PAXRUDRAFT_153590 [Paxillus rubicundulus Ve08.2h10]